MLGLFLYSSLSTGFRLLVEKDFRLYDNLLKTCIWRNPMVMKSHYVSIQNKEIMRLCIKKKKSITRFLKNFTLLATLLYAKMWLCDFNIDCPRTGFFSHRIYRKLQQARRWQWWQENKKLRKCPQAVTYTFHPKEKRIKEPLIVVRSWCFSSYVSPLQLALRQAKMDRSRTGTQDALSQ